MLKKYKEYSQKTENYVIIISSKGTIILKGEMIFL